jgi:hypothetical protein
MAKEESKIPQGQQAGQGQSYDEVLSNMSIEQKDNTIKQLDRQCGMLAQENIKLKQQMQVMQQSEFYTILDWNYKIAIDKSNIWDSEFRQACAKRVQEMMTPPAQENNNNPENNGQQ